MSQVINTNVASLNAQRNLQMSQTTLSTSLQRLSSGLRINSAKDDAAGLAISDRFTTQIRGINQAVRNANDGISLAQVGESALAEVTSNLQRIRELAVQSANATNSDSDRRALDLEVQQRLAEIDRIAGQTSFNGRKILDGSFGNAAFQIGANVGETINVGLSTSMRQADIGAIATATSVDLSTIIIEASDATAGTYTTGEITNLDFATVDATPATMALGAFTAGAGGDATSEFEIAFTDGTDTLTVTATDGVGAVSAANVAAAFVTAGFAADGTGEVDGFTLDLGVESTIEDAITNGTLTVTRADGSDFSASETINGAAYGTTTPTFANTVTTTNGAPANTDANATFDVEVDGSGSPVTVTLDQTYATIGDLAADIQSQLTGVTVTADGNALVFTSASTGAASSVAVSNYASVTNTTDEITGGTQEDGEAAVAATPLTITELTIQLGDSDAVTVEAGDYDSQTALLNAINTALGGNATASLDAETNEISFTSGENITIGGADAATVFSATEIEAGGSLDTVNVLTAANSNDAIQRIDAALTSVSELRSTFGALQNRFESTIANLQASSENLSASRSRILDADFAAETANLTRAQILQQAGVAMLAQANALPQNVLSLLR